MIGQVLLAGQIVAIVLIYLFVWRVMRAGTRDLLGGGDLQAGSSAGPRPDESTIIPAAALNRARQQAGIATTRIVVIASPHLRAGVPFAIGTGLRFGRATDNDVVLRDDYVSSHHAELQPPGTLVDLDSTNGTVVNGSALHGRIRLKSGDEFALGESRFRFEVLA